MVTDVPGEIHEDRIQNICQKKAQKNSWYKISAEVYRKDNKNEYDSGKDNVEFAARIHVI